MFKRRRHFFRIMSFPQHQTLLTLTFESTFSYFHPIKKLLGNFQSGATCHTGAERLWKLGHTREVTHQKLNSSRKRRYHGQLFFPRLFQCPICLGREGSLDSQASRDSLRLGETGNNCNSHVLDTVCKPFLVLICLFFLVRKKNRWFFKYQVKQWLTLCKMPFSFE